MGGAHSLMGGPGHACVLISGKGRIDQLTKDGPFLIELEMNGTSTEGIHLQRLKDS